MDAHSMDPQVVFATLKSLGGSPRRVLIVGCEPLVIDDGIGLSEPVGRAVEEAVRLVHSVVDDLAAERMSQEVVAKRSSDIVG